MYKGAVKDLTTAVEIDNACSFAYYNRGVCYQQLQEYELVSAIFQLLTFHVHTTLNDL